MMTQYLVRWQSGDDVSTVKNTAIDIYVNRDKSALVILDDIEEEIDRIEGDIVSKFTILAVYKL